MTFTTLYFLVFVAVVVLVYLLLPQKIKPHFIILASLVFYFFWKAWAPVFIIAFALFNFVMAKVLAKQKSKKFFVLLMSVSLSVILFFVFRYGIFNGIIAAITGGNTIMILFPLGFSYYMFKCVSYLIDVNNGTIAPEPRFDYFLIYVTYFPEVSMGPITRAVDFLPQIRIKKVIDTTALNKGLASQVHISV